MSVGYWSVTTGMRTHSCVLQQVCECTAVCTPVTPTDKLNGINISVGQYFDDADEERKAMVIENLN